MLDSEFKFKIRLKDYIRGIMSTQYNFFKFVIKINLIDFKLENFIVNIIKYFSMIPLIFIVSKKQLSSSAFKNYEVKIISKIIKKIDKEIVKNLYKSNLSKPLFLQISGWSSKKLNEIIIYDHDHSKINHKTKLNIKRRDVRLLKGVEFYKSGFTTYLDLKEQNIISHIVGVIQNTTEKFLFETTTNVKIQNLCSKCNHNEHIGFIDDMKPFFLGSKLDKASILSNLILYDSYFFTGVIELISESIFYKNFVKNHYIKLQNIIQLNNHLLDIKIMRQTSKDISSKYNFEYKLLNYTLDNSNDSKLFTYYNVELHFGKFLIKNDKLLNRFDSFLNQSLIAGEKDILLQDRNHDLITGFIIYGYNSKRFVDEAIILPSLVVSNYFHFLLENCVGLWLNRKNLNIQTPILIPSSTHKNMLEILRLIGFNNFILFNENEVVKINKAFTFTKSANIIDALERNINDFTISKEKTREFSDYILRILHAQHRDKNEYKKVFLSRRSNNRTLINQNSIEKIAIKNGYEVIYPEDLGFMDQVELFHTSSDLILVGGASMANLIFCKESTNILFLTNILLKKYKLVDEIASIRGFKVKYLYGKNRVSKLNLILNKYNFFHSNYSLNESTFKKLLLNG